MPLQLYEKEQILDACLAIFAQHGYEKTSTAMLAEAAGISKALIFHHFKSKQELYFCVLDRCFEKVTAELHFGDLSEYEDFFEAIDKLSHVKLDYYKKNSNEYKLMIEVFYRTPNELKTDMEERYSQLLTTRDKTLEFLFERVPLRDGVDRKQAFELIMVTVKHFENKLLTEITDQANLDEVYMERVLNQLNCFLTMIRYGIEQYQ